ncbi:MAG: hypothetical protein ABIP76_05105 [Verrucomicrobiota bacterium]
MTSSAKVGFARGWPAQSCLARFLSLFFAAFGFAHFTQAALQFDVFLGYDGIVPEASWFPITCEVRNDGPSFSAYFEISSGQFNDSQIRRVPLELPTNTRKRVVVPVFSSSRFGHWNFRLVDERGKVYAEQINTRPRRQTAWDIPMVGALSRSVAGLPVIPPIKSNQQELQTQPARLQVALFPDNPIALEGLDVFYLNSETALELKVPQRDALLAWLNGGGHLVVSVEQIADLSASGWLADLLPCQLTSSRTLKIDTAFQNWMQQGKVKLLETPTVTPPAKAGKKNVPQSKAVLGADPFSELVSDEKFEQQEMLVFTGALRDGTVQVDEQGIPLVVEAQRGRGRLTLLNFSAEREPFVSWKNRPWFWAKLAQVPVKLYQTSDYNSYGGSSIDGVFGAMIDSKQIRKLPLTWLLFLLVVYLLVIGPLDRYWLKKINRQMLTWITFPAYVLFFSGLIYFIGFQLRAGDSEFNELHIVDVLPHNDRAVLRGRGYASIYSPSNKRYPLAGEQPFAALRGEFNYSYGGAEENSRANIIHRANNFMAEVSVPVWTSQLYVSDWLESADLPVKLSAVRDGANWQVTAENLLDRKLTEARVVIESRVYPLGDLPAKQTTKIKLESNQGLALKDFVQQNGGQFFHAAQSRRRTFGDSVMAFNVPLCTMAASFSSQLNETQGNQQLLISPPGLDLSSLAEQGNMILLAWDASHLLTKPLNRFTPRRSHQDTLLRLVVPKENAPAL